MTIFQYRPGGGGGRSAGIPPFGRVASACSIINNVPRASEKDDDLANVRGHRARAIGLFANSVVTSSADTGCGSSWRRVGVGYLVVRVAAQSCRDDAGSIQAAAG